MIFNLGPSHSWGVSLDSVPSLIVLKRFQAKEMCITWKTLASAFLEMCLDWIMIDVTNPVPNLRD